MNAGGSVTGEAELPSAPPAAARRRPPDRALRRCAASRRRCGTLFVVSMLVFAGTEVLPGDAASAVLGQVGDAGSSSRELRDADGSRPARSSVRYADWLGGLRRAATSATRRPATRPAASCRSGARSSRALANSLILAAHHGAADDPALAPARGRSRRARAGRPADHGISHRPRSRMHLAARVRDRLAADPRASSRGSTLLPPVALLAPGESPLSHPNAARAAGAHAARRDARGVRAHDARRHDRGAALGLRPDGAAERLPRAPRGLALRAAQRARAGRAGLRPEPPVPARRRSSSSSTSSPTPGLGKELVDAVAIRDVRAVQSIAILIASPSTSSSTSIADLLVRAARAEAADGSA